MKNRHLDIIFSFVQSLDGCTIDLIDPTNMRNCEPERHLFILVKKFSAWFSEFEVPF